MRDDDSPALDDEPRRWAIELLAMLDALAPGENRTIRLVYFARRPHEEVAAQLGLTTSAVAHLVATGLQQLAVQLGVRSLPA